MDDETEISGAQPVLIKLPKGDIKLARLVVGGHKVSEVRLGRLRIPSKAILGNPYGASLAHDGGSRWSRIQRTELRGAFLSDSELEETEYSDWESAAKESREGHIRATDSALNNAAFLSKSNFSQEKYLRKKHDKFAKEITLLKPSLSDFCDSCTTEIRADLLGSLLRFSASKFGDSVGIIDDTAGILVTALLQRGCRVDRYVTGRSTGQEKALHMFGLEKADSLRVIRNDTVAPTGVEYDSLVFTHNGTAEVDIGEAYRALEPMLRLGGSLAIYSRTIEPLLELLYALRNFQDEDSSGSRFINIQLTEQMSREQEILKERTHPIMQQSLNLFQGFILSAVKVVPTPIDDTPSA